MSNLNTTPMMTTTSATPVVSTTAVPVVPVATATTVLPTKAMASTTGAVPLVGAAPVGVPLVGVPVGAATGPVMHGPTNVIEHQPIIERQVIREHPVEVRHEHHVQPVIHETERQIQPIIQTQVTTETKVMETDRDVMLPPVMETRGGIPAPSTVVSAVPVVPLATTTTGTGVMGTGAPRHASIGQKLKGTVKEVQGTLTHNPAKKEEGRLLKQGIDPTRHTMA
jgi:hypothetical protein